jgi:hypothetical protein
LVRVARQGVVRTVQLYQYGSGNGATAPRVRVATQYQYYSSSNP